METNGFWSLPACPGAFRLALLPGPSGETFELRSEDAVEVSSFLSEPMPVKVAVRPGRKEADLRRKAAGRRPRRARGGRTRSNASLPTIHVFSVASGHLYERLLSIMVLSVTNHTKNPVHFWFVSNFLSPRFIRTLPQLMAKVGASYDLVSFKWPSWLRYQQEKQRLIWAYKILFLDVLFPMDVPRVIFIDSDLVIRADVRELWDMDLKGRPYGFTPFCSGTLKKEDGSTVKRFNNETTGFRFWDSGYWHGHLGKDTSYHISALFVVDLVEFRANSVGDKLRNTYNMLTADPNSLANLDQDLPNFAQKGNDPVPIFSLPPEWLWCETWCSEDVKPFAKAIDLCQNPKTKESKTAMARRIIAEWDAYHGEVLRLQHSEADAADAAVGGSLGPASPRHASRSEEL